MSSCIIESDVLTAEPGGLFHACWARLAYWAAQPVQAQAFAEV